MPIAGEETPAFATARMAFPAAAAPLGQIEKRSYRAILDRFTTESSHTLPRADRQLGAMMRHMHLFSARTILLELLARKFWCCPAPCH
jgi:hypothetical protein